MSGCKPLYPKGPRLFFGKDDLSCLRKKLQHPDCAPVWQRLLEGCEALLKDDVPAVIRRHLGAQHLAFAGVIENRMDWVERARQEVLADATRPEWGPAKESHGGRVGLRSAGVLSRLTLVRDWLDGFWSDAELDVLRDAAWNKGLLPYYEDYKKQKPYMRWHTTNGTCVISGPTVMAALRFGDEMDTSSVLEVAVDTVRKAIRAHDADGGYPEGMLYWNYGLRHLLLAVEPLRRLCGLNLYDEPFLKNTGDHALHGIEPGLVHCNNYADGYSHTHLWPPVAALARAQRRTDWQWLAKRLIRHDWGMDGESLEYSLFYLLFYDPDLPATSPTEEQRTCLFSGMQQLSMRSSWEDDAIHVFWLNGPSNVSHNHLHLNHFSLSAFGERLLIDSGKHDYKKNMQDPRKLTQGHNSLLVDGEGQVITLDDAIFCNRVRAGEWGTTYGEFQSLRHQGQSVLATGHTVGAYPGRLRCFDRTLAFLDKRLLLLHDVVEPESGNVSLEWRFHVAGEIISCENSRADVRHGKVTLSLLFMSAAPFEVGQGTGETEISVTETPIPYISVTMKNCDKQLHMFALLVPENDKPFIKAELAMEKKKVVVLHQQGRYVYAPERRALLDDTET